MRFVELYDTMNEWEGLKMNMFSQRLRELRGNKTQAEVAQEIGLTSSAYSMYEGGRREPNFDTLILIANHYGVSSDYLLGRTDCQSPEIDVQAICKKTGLSDSAVKSISYAYSTDKLLECYYDESYQKIPKWTEKKEAVFSILNYLLSKPTFFDLLYTLNRFDEEAKAQKQFNMDFGLRLLELREQLPEDMQDYLMDPMSYDYSQKKRTEFAIEALINSLRYFAKQELMRQEGSNGET